jgi:FKBP-type peptidyl-prolyl cis-trans isomerase
MSVSCRKKLHNAKAQAAIAAKREDVSVQQQNNVLTILQGISGECARQAKQNKTKQNKTKQNKTKQNKTKQNKTKQNKTKQNKTKQNKIKQHSTNLWLTCHQP